VNGSILTKYKHLYVIIASENSSEVIL
jgi:hypothetical protein